MSLIPALCGLECEDVVLMRAVGNIRAHKLNTDEFISLCLYCIHSASSRDVSDGEEESDCDGDGDGDGVGGSLIYRYRQGL